jgi:hypothetical protein
MISPFGLYARRQLISQNLFAAAPLDVWLFHQHLGKAWVLANCRQHWCL